MALGAVNFKNDWMVDKGVDPKAIAAAEALMPLGDIAAKVNIPGNDGTIVAPTQMDIPGLGADQSVRPIGYFGERFPEGHPALEYAPNPGISGPIRGPMQPVPGGVPIPEGTIYDAENSRKEWPTYFEGDWEPDEGNMPGYTY